MLLGLASLALGLALAGVVVLPLQSPQCLRLGRPTNDCKNQQTRNCGGHWSDDQQMPRQRRCTIEEVADDEHVEHLPEYRREDERTGQLELDVLTL